MTEAMAGQFWLGTCCCSGVWRDAKLRLVDRVFVDWLRTPCLQVEKEDAVVVFGNEADRMARKDTPPTFAKKVAIVAIL